MRKHHPQLSKKPPSNMNIGIAEKIKIIIDKILWCTLQRASRIAGNEMVRLRPYKSCDAEIIASWCRDEATYMKWSGGRFGPFPITAEAIELKYQHNGGCVEPDNFYPMTAFDENGIVGHLIMRYLQGNNKILRFGWVIVDDAKRGQGYGKQILILSMKYAFEILKVEKITIRVHEDNLPAYNCYKAIGFTENATADEEYDEVNGRKVKLIELDISKSKYCESAD